MPEQTQQSCWNLRVSAEAERGGRKYMEDVALVDFRRENNIEYAVFGIFDGHGGRQAARFAKAHLMNFIRQQKCFYSSRPENVKKAIHEGFIACHEAMRRKLHEWPKTMLGHPCTAGTTASIAIIRGNMLYVAYVGDSGIVMGYEKTSQSSENCESTENSSQSISQTGSINYTMPSSMTFTGWASEGPAYSSSHSSINKQKTSYFYRELTTDHKPESIVEKRRIESSGGHVAMKNGVHRVIWNRPRLAPGRENEFDRIPFLAVGRSLGDLWSYCPNTNEFVVSPVPDIEVYDLTPKNEKTRFIIVASDGIWNMIRPWDAVHLVSTFSKRKENGKAEGSYAHDIVREALSRWRLRGMRADNSTAVIVWLDRATGSSNRNFVNRAWSSDNIVKHNTFTQLPAQSAAIKINADNPEDLNKIASIEQTVKHEVEQRTDILDENSTITAECEATTITKRTDLTHQCLSALGNQLDGNEDDDDTDITFDITDNQDNLEPAKYHSAKRMKKFADLSIPARLLTIASDDESDDNGQTNSGTVNNTSTNPANTSITNVNEIIEKDQNKNSNVKPSSSKSSNNQIILVEPEIVNLPEQGKNVAKTAPTTASKTTTTPTAVTTNMVQPNNDVNTINNNETTAQTIIKEANNQNDEISSFTKNTDCIHQDLCSDDPNLPAISITTQTRNTSTSIITTTTTTIVTRKRSSSESNNSKSSNENNMLNYDASNPNALAKKRKKSDPFVECDRDIGINDVLAENQNQNTSQVDKNTDKTKGCNSSLNTTEMQSNDSNLDQNSSKNKALANTRRSRRLISKGEGSK